MRDHNYIDDEGRRIPIANLPTVTIQELLCTGFKIYSSDGMNDPVSAVLERLRIELVIRELGLR